MTLVPLAVLLAQEIFGDVDAHEVQAHLDQALEAPGDYPHPTGAEPEDEDDDDRREELDEVDARDRESLDPEELEDRLREELIDRRSVETPAIFGSGHDKARSLSKQRWLQLRGTGDKPLRRWAMS